MTPDRLRECLDALEWTQRGFARLLRRDEGNVRQMARGAVPVPDDVAAWLEALMSFLTAHPLPVRKFPID